MFLVVFEFVYSIWSDVTFSQFPAVYGMSLSEGFVRRKWIDAPRVNHEAENCYETFKIGRNSIICRPKEDKIDG
jgi:hypothetical protein